MQIVTGTGLTVIGRNDPLPELARSLLIRSDVNALSKVGL